MRYYYVNERRAQPFVPHTFPGPSPLGAAGGGGGRPSHTPAGRQGPPLQVSSRGGGGGAAGNRQASRLMATSPGEALTGTWRRVWNPHTKSGDRSRELRASRVRREGTLGRKQRGFRAQVDGSRRTEREDEGLTLARSHRGRTEGEPADRAGMVAGTVLPPPPVAGPQGRGVLTVSSPHRTRCSPCLLGPACGGTGCRSHENQHRRRHVFTR